MTPLASYNHNQNLSFSMTNLTKVVTRFAERLRLTSSGYPEI